MVASGELRFVLGGQQLTQRKPEIGAWVSANCTVVTLPGMSQPPSGRPLGPDGGQDTILYDCGT
jgi:hypothetical protein